jgi:hypothetical protein
MEMSRSRRKTAAIGMTTAPSDKPFKVDEHRAERHTVRAALKRSLDSDDKALHSKVYGDPWKVTPIPTKRRGALFETTGAKTLRRREYMMMASSMSLPQCSIYGFIYFCRHR